MAIVNVAIRLNRKAGQAENVRIALGGVARTILRAKEAEKRMEGKAISPSLIEEVSNAVQNEIKPIGTVHMSAGYKKHLAVVLVKRALMQATQTS